MDGYVIAADLAGGKKTTSGDFNVIVALGRHASSFYLLDCYRERADFPDVVAAFKKIATRYPSAGKFVEQAAAGASLVASLQSQIPGLVPVPPRGDKEGRLMGVHHFFRAGNVHLPEDWPWLEGAIQELVTFPRSRHDDFVDALTLTLAQIAFAVDEEYEQKRTSRIRGLLSAKPTNIEGNKRAVISWLDEKLAKSYPKYAPARETDYRPGEPFEVEPEPAQCSGGNVTTGPQFGAWRR
jgi:predicted phage terminase large subunit-like protein